MCKHNGSLATKKGWPEFSSGHDVKWANSQCFSMFRVMNTSLLKYFGTSGCESRTLPKPINLMFQLHQVKYNLIEDNHGMFCVHYFMFKCLCCVVLNIMCFQHFLTVIFCCCYVMKKLLRVSLFIQEIHHPLTQSTVGVWQMSMVGIFQ